jgi:Fe-S-cluster containining protein
VGVTVPELVAIVAHLEQTLSAEALDALRTRVEAAHLNARGLTREERNSPEHPCPLLENHRCSVYDVRPLACRGAHSLDEKACAEKLRNRELRAAYERGELPGHAFAEPIRAVHAVSAGIQLGLFEGLGLDVRPLDLAAALDALLREQAPGAPSEPAGRVERWLSGAPTFADTRGGDATDDPAQVALAGAVALPTPEPASEKPR